MPSPFPGMNPYIEHPDAWSDFHERYLAVLARELGRALPREFFVKVDQNVYGHDAEGGSGLSLIGRGDAFVVARSEAVPSGPLGRLATTPASGLVTLAEELSTEESFLEIRDARSRAVITVLELLSPSNKRPGYKRDQFLAKRRALVVSQSNYVEIDLLRGWPRLPLHGRPPCDYYVLVSRASARPRAEFWAVGLRDVLPVIPVPLREDAAFVPLGLQTALHEVYDDATYERYVYDQDPVPPLSPGDTAWARTLAAPG